MGLRCGFRSGNREAIIHVDGELLGQISELANDVVLERKMVLL